MSAFSALTADGSSQGETPRDEAKMMTPEQVARIVIRGIERRKRLCLMEAEAPTLYQRNSPPASRPYVLYGYGPGTGFAAEMTEQNENIKDRIAETTILD